MFLIDIYPGSGATYRHLYDLSISDPASPVFPFAFSIHQTFNPPYFNFVFPGPVEHRIVWTGTVQSIVFAANGIKGLGQAVSIRRQFKVYLEQSCTDFRDVETWDSPG